MGRLGSLAGETGTAVYAWALMDNQAHMLLGSGSLGLAKLLRRLLTGYAESYNLRHRRHGHVFENRCKSIVCDGDSYFTELVRYIHLNPYGGGSGESIEGWRDLFACFRVRSCETFKHVSMVRRPSVGLRWANPTYEGLFRHFCETVVRLGPCSFLSSTVGSSSPSPWSPVSFHPV